MPAVSFLKPIAVQNAHPGNSDPLDEQAFIVRVLNFLQATPEWDSTVVIIAYDDSDGWYDHQIGPIVNQSETSQDALSATGQCGTGGSTGSLPGYEGTGHAQGRCGYGPRQPLLVVSPFSKQNYVEHSVSDQSSILRFIEDVFADGSRIPGSFDAVAGSLWPMLNLDDHGNSIRGHADVLFLNETTGEPAPPPPGYKGNGNWNGNGKGGRK
jgi:phospholipase C